MLHTCGARGSYRESADGQDTANMTNLAFKGIVGVRAMAEMSRALGEEFDAQQYEVRSALT